MGNVVVNPEVLEFASPHCTMMPFANSSQPLRAVDELPSPQCETRN